MSPKFIFEAKPANGRKRASDGSYGNMCWVFSYKSCKNAWIHFPMSEWIGGFILCFIEIKMPGKVRNVHAEILFLLRTAPQTCFHRIIAETSWFI